MNRWGAPVWQRLSWLPLCDPQLVAGLRQGLIGFERKVQDKTNVILLGLLIGWLAWIGTAYLALGRLSFVSNIDVADCVYPQIAPIIDMLKEGRFSFWNPSLAGGADTLGDFNSAIFSVIAFFFLPPWLASGVILLSIHALAVVGMYLLLRVGFDVPRGMAGFGGFLYSQFLFWWYGFFVYVFPCGYILAAAPLIAAWLLQVRGLSLGSIAISLTLGLLIAFGGHYSWSVFIFMVVAALVFVFSERRFGVWIVHLAVIGVVCFIIQLPFFLANLATAPLSSRVFGEVYYRHDGPLKFNLDLFVPWLKADLAYIRPSVWLIALFTIISLAIPVRAAIAVAFYCGVHAVNQALPYALALLSAGGYHVYSDGSWGGPYEFRFYMANPFIAVLAFILAIDYPWKYLRGAREPAVSPPLPVVLLLIALTISPIWDFARERAMQAYDMTLASYRAAHEGLNYVTNYEQPALKELADALPDRHAYRVATVAFNGRNPPLAAGKTALPSLYGPFQIAYGFETADGYASNLVGRYVLYWHMMVMGRDFDDLSYLKDYAARFEKPDWAFPQKLYLPEPAGPRHTSKSDCADVPTGWRFSEVFDLGMLSLTNAAYIVSAFPLDEPRFRLLPSPIRQRQEELLCASPDVKMHALRQEGIPPMPLYVYHNEDVMPRVFAPGRVEILENTAELLKSLRGRGAESLRQAALVVGTDVEAAGAKLPREQSISVNKVTIQDDRAAVDIETATGGLLVVANSYMPFWKAEVDGSPAPVIPVYHAFQGVVVPPGGKVVRLRYCPTYLPFVCR